MPNFASFNTNPDDLRTLIFGKDTTATSRALVTDASGRLLNIQMDGTITSVLGATITAGTLNNLLNGTITSVLGATITAGTLSNLLNGTITSVLGATITAGTLSSVTSISQKSFQEQQTLNVVTADAFTALPAVTTSVFGTYSFFIYNKGPGTNKVDARVEISANGTNWFDDVDTVTGIAVGSVDVLVPKRFLKYTRLAYRSSTAGSPTTIDVFFNGQGT
ncbi:DUF6385 domain-containing protein [Effusibacillus pohliae]|uniref:DUF6385 domain-containing protein n=1 Tax=Effusibacillus pohliae TaxID=232270 RepID=UPI0003753F38|nr:DUF6385 domain-containing protein [Effusibacillus pohliae]